MATNTENYGYIKPGEDDFYDINQQNQNMDMIDENMKENADKIRDHTENGDIHTSAKEKSKLASIEEGANKYTHPSTHPATMITEDATHRFTNDTDKAKLAGIEEGANKYNHPKYIEGTAQGDTDKTLTFGGTFKVPKVIYDEQGHVIGKGTTTMTMPPNPNTSTLLTNENLDNYNTFSKCGNYYAKGSNSVTNKPSGIDAFGLEIIGVAETVILQRLTTYTTLHTYIRFYNTTIGWSGWTKLVDNTDIDNSGRNFLRNSSFNNGINFWAFPSGGVIEDEKFMGNNIVTITNTSTTTRATILQYLLGSKSTFNSTSRGIDDVLISGQAYTLSGWVRLNNDNVASYNSTVTFRLCPTPSTPTYYIDVADIVCSKSILTVGEWTYISKTFTMPTFETYYSAQVMVSCGCNSSGLPISISASMLKLEKGNIATGYIPAIEDLQSQIDDNARRVAIVGSSAVDTTSGWYKVASQDMSGQSSTNLTFLVTSTFEKQSSGILQIQLSQANDIITLRSFSCLVRRGLDLSHFRLVVDSTTHIWTLYAYTEGRWYYKTFEIINQSDIGKKVIPRLVFTDNSTKETTAPIIQHSPTDAGIVENANRLSTARNINSVPFNGLNDISINKLVPILLPSSSDLDTYNTVAHCGNYYAASNNSITHKPSGVDAFSLEILPTNNTTGICQRLMATNTASIHTRFYYNGTWTPWTKLINDTDTVSKATQLATARTIKVGDTSKTFDGSKDVSWTLAEIGAATVERGTFSPVLCSTYGSAITLPSGNTFVNSGYYRVIGDLVYFNLCVTITGNASGGFSSNTNYVVRNLPFTSTGNNCTTKVHFYSDNGLNANTIATISSGYNDVLLISGGTAISTTGRGSIYINGTYLKG